MNKNFYLHKSLDTFSGIINLTDSIYQISVDIILFTSFKIISFTMTYLNLSSIPLSWVERKSYTLEYKNLFLYKVH
jgi:hypothetical protein